MHCQIPKKLRADLRKEIQTVCMGKGHQQETLFLATATPARVIVLVKLEELLKADQPPPTGMDTIR